jgi:hypothetical protein
LTVNSSLEWCFKWECKSHKGSATPDRTIEERTVSCIVKLHNAMAAKRTIFTDCPFL